MKLSTEQLQSLNGCEQAVTFGIQNELAYFSHHALDRMKERDITLDDVADTIKNGFAVKHDTLGRISYATSEFTVVIQLEETGHVRIVTAYPPNLIPPRYVPSCLRKRATVGTKSTKYLRAQIEAASEA